MSNRCDRCLYWRPLEGHPPNNPDRALGNCHCLPPTTTGWPKSKAADFCGDFSPAMRAAPAKEITQ
jgi:hypothetical protein